jgi:hypothetical protein
MNETTLAAIRTQLDDAALSEAWEQGRRLTVGEAATPALDSETDGTLPAPVADAEHGRHRAAREPRGAERAAGSVRP